MCFSLLTDLHMTKSIGEGKSGVKSGHVNLEFNSYTEPDATDSDGYTQPVCNAGVAAGDSHPGICLTESNEYLQPVSNQGAMPNKRHTDPQPHGGHQYVNLPQNNGTGHGAREIMGHLPGGNETPGPIYERNVDDRTSNGVHVYTGLKVDQSQENICPV